MFLEMNENTIDFIWSDKKRHQITIEDGSGEVDINQLKETYRKTIMDKKDKCEDLYYLAIGLEGNPDIGLGFVIGWVLKSIKDQNEKMNSSKWNIKHTVHELSDDEYRTIMASSLRKLADLMENDHDTSIKQMPILGGNSDPSELF